MMLRCLACSIVMVAVMAATCLCADPSSLAFKPGDEGGFYGEEKGTSLGRKGDITDFGNPGNR